MNDDRTEDAAGRAEARDRAGKADPEPSLARRFGQIGVLGWMIVIPILVGVYAGSWLDHWLGHRHPDVGGTAFRGRRSGPLAGAALDARAMMADPAIIAAAALSGIAMGWVHFVTLTRVTAMLVAGRIAGVGLQMARFALLGAFLWLCAKGGWPVLLAGAFGVLAGRALVLWRFRSWKAR
jgi:hypothetical protein